MRKNGDDKEIEKFLLGTGINSEGKTINEIWQYDPKQLEREHHYIQWLFPLDEPSKADKKAPYIHNIDVFLKSAHLGQIHASIRESFGLMLNFYGFRMKYDAADMSDIEKSKAWIEPENSEKPEWLVIRNHNLKRLTRIQRSLHLFGIEPEAKAMDAWLEILIRKYPKETRKAAPYWHGEKKPAFAMSTFIPLRKRIVRCMQNILKQ